MASGTEDGGDRSATKPRSRVRQATLHDAGRIRDIYAHYVLHSTATFEEEPPTVEAMRTRMSSTLSRDAPFLVVERDQEVLGYAYADQFRERSAFRYSLEDSVYIAPGREGCGFGSMLLAALLERCEAGPWSQVIALIGDSGNLASIALHRKFGFEPVGALKDVGFKFGRWIDAPIMQRALKRGASRLLKF